LVLDEFALHKGSIEIWRAIYPSIANPLKRQYKLRILSTPNGLGNKFADIWHEQDSAWSKHRTTIYDAQAAGLGVDLDELRKQAGDEDTWRQEFECEFIDSDRCAFSYELIAQCESNDATLSWGANSAESGDLVALGIDVGSIHDPTVAVTVQRVGDKIIFRDRLVLRGMALSDQDDALDALVRRAGKVSIDASGIGLDLAQRMSRRHGGKITAQSITPKWKREAFVHLQGLMSDKRLLVPMDRDLREDLHAYQVHGAGELASFSAPRNALGHSDTTSALAHACDAAKELFTPCEPIRFSGSYFFGGGKKSGRAITIC
jgi:phage FluMu gp28-like protein